MHTIRTFRLSVAAPLLALALLGAACSSKDDGGAIKARRGATSTIENMTPQGAALRTVAAGVITACTHFSRVPFEFQDNGQPAGIDVDMLKAVTGRMGLRANFVDTPADGLTAALRAGTCDVAISSVAITPERQRDNDFSTPYFDVVQSLLVRRGDAERYKDLPDLRGQVIGVQSGTTSAAYAAAHAVAAGAQVRELADSAAVVAALKAGQVAAALQDLPVNLYYATDAALAVTKQFTDQKESYGIVIPKGKSELKRAVDDAIRAIRGDDTYNTILRAYLGADYGKV